MVKRATMAQVAKLAGVSPSTVSLVFNKVPHNRIPPQTAQRVLEAAEKLGYTPNSAARTLRTGSTQAYGLLSNEVTTTRFASEIISGAIEKAAENKHMVMINECPDFMQASASLQTLLDRQVDGLLVALMRNRQIQLPDLSLPTVVINGYSPKTYSVLPDEKQAGYQAVQYLVERGHQKICLIGRHPSAIPPEVSHTIPIRFTGIDQAFTDYKIQTVWEYPVAYWEPNHGRQAGEKFLKWFINQSAKARPTAMICANDRLAFGFYQSLWEHGIVPGQDLSIISFDNEDLGKYVHPGLTTIELPYQQMGKRAVEILTGQTQNCLVPMPIIERESVITLN